jgi:phage terminase large subunit
VATYWHMLPEYAQARKAIWNAINPHTGIRRIDEAFPQAIRASTNEQEMFIRFINGSTWQVVGSDSYNSLVGTPPYGLVMSEWALADPAAWAYLAPILEENGGWALFITTPRGKNHAHGMYKMAQHDPKWFAQKQTVEDTGFPIDRVESARKEYHGIFGIDAGDALIEQEYYCSFESAVLGAVYGAQMTRADKEGRIGNVPYDPELKVFTAWDLGYDDSTAIWFWQIAKAAEQTELRIIGYYEASGQAIGHYCDYVKNKPWNYGGHYVPHDAANKLLAAGGRSIYHQMTQEYGLKNCHIIPATTQQNSIEAARKTIDSCWFDDSCEKGIESLRQYQFEWDDDKRTFKSKPLHNWASHGADAFEIIGQVWRKPILEKKEDPRWGASTFNELLEQSRRKRMEDE